MKIIAVYGVLTYSRMRTVSTNLKIDRAARGKEMMTS